ncbi:MAG: DUF4097 domain-containing protein [Gemmatimonadota bacterium]
MHKTVVIWLGAALGASATAVSGPLAGQQPERYELAGERVAIYNLAGQLRVVPGSGRTVSVSVSRGGEDASRLRIESGALEGRETLRVLFPGDRIVYREIGRGSRSQMRVREDGTFGRAGRRVTVAGSGEGTRAYADLTVSVPAGREVAVYLGVGKAHASGVEADLLLDTHAGSVTVERHRGSLNVDTGSGRVEVADVEGDLLVDTGSGGVRATGVRGDRILIDTGSGGVIGSELRSERLLVDTGSGRIELSGVSAQEVSLDTGSGGVELELTGGIRELLVDTGSGGVTLRVPEGLGARFDVETGSGGIESDLPLSVSRAGRSHLQGTLGDGSGRIHIETGSGGVRILRR